jgi:hypothetical protein
MKRNIETYRPLNLFSKNNTDKTRSRIVDVGEFLPDETDGFIEIARICLSSSTGDIISIRVKQSGSEYEMDVVDEYETIFLDYQKTFQTIPTQEEVFSVIRDMHTELKSNYYWLEIVQMNELTTIKEITDFIYIDSNVYPELNTLLVEFFKENGYP